MPEQMRRLAVYRGLKAFLERIKYQPADVAKGIMQAYVIVRYLSVVRYFAVYLQAGQSAVTVTVTTSPFAAASQ